MKLPSTSEQVIFVERLLIGLVQGIALYVLFQAVLSKLWPAIDNTVFQSMLATALFAPAIAIVSVGNLRARTALLWIALASVVSACLGSYAGFREPGPQISVYWAAWPTANFFGLAVLFFIGHALVAAADTDRRRIASFATYFDVVWKLATQSALTFQFVGLFWGILWLGAELFRAIGIEFFATTIQQNWFWIPATTLAASMALHLTDARAGLVRGARTLALNLLSWLMPIMVLIGAAFVAALPFTGLQPLWSTKHATASLLAATAILVLLINGHFQDGGPDSNKSRVLTYARFVAAVVLTPLVILAGIGLRLRAEQYGWTPPRVIAAACLIVAACHALGYALAALRSGPALRGLPATNVISAFVTLAILFALLTPIADPVRLSVADQVSRLESGAIAPDKFDYAFLRYRGGRYGQEALERLKDKQDGPNAAQIAARAAKELSHDVRTMKAAQAATLAATPSTRAANIAVLQPAGQKLPESFLQEDWKTAQFPGRLPRCLIFTTVKCNAILLDIDGDGASEILLIDSQGGGTTVFKETAAGSWTPMGTVTNVTCPGAREALGSGKYQLVPSLPMDIIANGNRLRLNVGCTATLR